jgi:Sec-independent protein translocase protein TatA
MITASNQMVNGHPRNAAELAVSLVGLVFPYDVRNMQRSLASLQTRMRELEAKAKGDQASTARVEQGLKVLEAEMATIRNEYNMTSGVTLPQNVEGRVLEVGEEMLEKATNNANSINDALQAVRAAMGDLERERSQLLRKQAEQQKQAEDTAQRPDEDEISTASEDEEDLDPRPSRRSGRQPKDGSVVAARASERGMLFFGCFVDLLTL